MTKKELGAILSSLREASGKSREEVAELLNRSVKTVGHWETGYAQPDANTLFLLCTIYGADLNASFGFEPTNERPQLSPDALKVAEAYNGLDDHGKAAVDSILQCELDRMASKPPEVPATYFVIPFFPHPSSAGTGTEAFGEEPENLRLVKEPPKGASYVVPVSGDSMEPTYQDGDMVFVTVRNEIDKGQVGIFYMDGQQWIKEKGDGVLISHNSEYQPRPIVDGAQCQGLVLGLCDSSYFEN